MANQSFTSPTAALIFASWEREGRAERPRTYLGASIIGHECDMFLWLNFRGVFNEKFDGRMYRLFNRGQREEEVFCNDLRRIGCEVRDRDPSTGGQFAVNDLGGHFSGHLDAVARGFNEAPKQWFVCEFKTHSDASFKKLVKEGVQKAKPMHYAQMQVYMGQTQLSKAFYMAVNKDNDDLWCEVINFNEEYFKVIMSRAKHIIDTCMPTRCATRPDDFRCKACKAHALCWHTAKEFVDSSVQCTCRTCCHATADTEHEGANWTCRLGHSCSTEKTGCEDHLLIPLFINAEIKDGTNSSITFTTDEGEFTIGKGGFTIDELKHFGKDELKGVLAVKDGNTGASVVSSNTLERKYADRNRFGIYFSGSVKELNEECANHVSINFNKPIRSEEFGGKSYYEYEDDVLVIIDKDNATILMENPPF